MPGYPLGLRNNNPGNLRTGDNWQGMTGENKGFVVFENIAYGLRALAIDLRTKISNGYNTIELIIFRYAPPSENDPLAYIDKVSNFTGLPQNRVLQPDSETLARLMKAIIFVEIGSAFAPLITDLDINEGIDLMSGISAGKVGFGVASALLLLALYLLATMPKMNKS